MRLEWTLVPVSACILIGCDSGFDLGPEQERPDCISSATRPGQSVTVSGAVLDHVTDEPVSGVDVAFNTAWDIRSDFPAACEPLSTFSSSSDGRFGPATIDVGSPRNPPIALFLVTGDGVADTASDQTLTCEEGDCGELEHTIAAPAGDLADSWRRDLEAGGMPNARSRGLVLFTFNEADGSPAEGVVPQTLSGSLELEPDVEVRFLEPDRTTLAPLGTGATTASGMAIIGLNEEIDSENIFGSRGDDTWEIVGVLDPPGWIFLEDRRLDAAR